jgi:hypothetical protein
VIAFCAGCAVDWAPAGLATVEGLSAPKAVVYDPDLGALSMPPVDVRRAGQSRRDRIARGKPLRAVDVAEAMMRPEIGIHGPNTARRR